MEVRRDALDDSQVVDDRLSAFNFVNLFEVKA